MKLAMVGDYPRDPGRIGGGVEAVIACTAEKLARYPDLDLHVVTLRDDVQRYEVRRVAGYTVHYLPASFRFANLTFFAVNKWRLRRGLRRLRPDLIHAHVAGPYAEVAFSLGCPAVLTPHGIRYREAKLKPGWVNQHIRYPLWRREERLGLQVARHIISISPYIEQEFAAVIRGQVYRIEVPIGDEFFDIADHTQSGRVLFVGQLSPRKGVFELIQTLPHLCQRFPALSVRFAGKVAEEYGADYFPMIQNYVRAHGLERHVAFLDQLPQAELMREYAECEVLVLPSYQETAPSVIEQAMAARKPVVSTRVGGIPHLVAHGETGLLVEPGDVPALTEALARLLADPDLRRSMGGRGRQAAETRFRADVVAEQTLSVYRQMLAARFAVNGQH